MTALTTPRWWAHLYAVLACYAWRPCPSCGAPFGAQEHGQSHHFETIPGSTPDSHRLICPVCTDKGVGCRAYEGSWHHDGCDVVTDEEIWPTQDGDVPPGRIGPYSMEERGRWLQLGDVRDAAFGGTGAATSLGESTRQIELINRAINPPRETEEEAADRSSRAQERKARETAARAAVLARHHELVADVDNPIVGRLLVDHRPHAGPDGLVCHGCPQNHWYDAVEGQEVSARQDAPCSVWKTIESMQRRAA